MSNFRALRRILSWTRIATGSRAATALDPQPKAARRTECPNTVRALGVYTLTSNRLIQAPNEIIRQTRKSNGVLPAITASR